MNEDQRALPAETLDAQAQRAYERLMAARATSGIERGDPLDPVVVAIGECMQVMARTATAVGANLGNAKSAGEAQARAGAVELEKQLVPVLAKSVPRAAQRAVEQQRWVAIAIACAVAAALVWVTWFVTSATAHAAALSANRDVANLLQTPGGHAALFLYRTNGDALANELAACREHQFHNGKSSRLQCELAAWTETRGTYHEGDVSPFERARSFALEVRAWQAVVALVALYVLYSIVKVFRYA